MENTAFTLSALFFAVYMFFAEKGYIHILQLNSYRPERYLRWMGENKMKAAYLRAVILLFSLIIALHKSAGRIGDLETLRERREKDPRRPQEP